jgi:uncharacterized protein (TIGR02246 family)
MSAYSVVTDPAALPVAFEETLNAGDLEGLLALIAPGAVARRVTGETLVGREAVHAELAGMIAGGAQLKNAHRHTLVGAETALLVTDWTLAITSPTGERITSAGTTANIAHRDAAGAWRLTVLNPLGLD